MRLTLAFGTNLLLFKKKIKHLRTVSFRVIFTRCMSHLQEWDLRSIAQHSNHLKAE